MTNSIQFLEAAGINAQMSGAEYAASVALLQIDPAQKQALLDRDHLALAVLLDGRKVMYCMIMLPDNDEPEPLQDDDDDVPEREE